MSTKDNANIPVDYQKILDAFTRAADGDYTTEITLSTDDPLLKTIAIEFNKMIKEIKGTINELRDSNRQLDSMVKKFKRIFDGSRDIIILINKYGTIVDINKSVKEILDYDPEELKGKHFAKAGVILGEEIPQVLERFNTAITKGIGKNVFRMKCVTKEGRILCMEASIKLLKNEENIEGIIAVLRDITKHIQADTKLREEKEKLRSIVSSIEDVILIVDKELRLIECYKSSAYQENFVFATIESYLGKSIKSFFPRSIAGEMEKLIQFCLKTGQIQQIDYSLTAQKKTLWFNTRIAPLLNSDGHITGVSILIRDITQQKEMEQALEESEEKYHKIFEQSPQGFIILDAEGRITDVNKKICEWLGYKRQEVIGKDHIMYPFLTKSGKIMAMRKFIQRLSGKYVQPYELEFIAKDGTVYIGEIDARPIKDENGNIKLIVVMVTDVTRRR
ncbi:MAG: PAS domain S-box protein [candidate division WOR-3 bacterium]